jgi:hypothetical protein
MANTSAAADHTYGNFVEPRTPGIGRLGRGESVLIIIALAIFGLVMMSNLWGGVIYFLVVAPLMWQSLKKDKFGVSAFEKRAERFMFNHAKKNQRTQYRSGPVGVIPSGTYQLPGLLAASTAYKCRDGLGRSFALIHVPHTDHYSVAFLTEAEGMTLTDQAQIERWVAEWGAFMRECGYESDIAGGSVIVEVAPDFGGRLKQHIEPQLSKHASEVGRTMMLQAIDPDVSRSSMVRTWVTLTFTGSAGFGSPPRSVEDVAVSVASRLPDIGSRIELAGGTDAVPVSVTSLSRMIRTSYEPGIAEDIERVMSDPGERVNFDWDNAGPVAHDAGWESMRHDSGVSASYTMGIAPRGEVRSRILADLLKPQAEMTRKRVALLFRPIPVSEAGDVAERDVKHLGARAGSTKQELSSSAQAVVAASQTAREEATGAGLVNFGLAVTATVTDPDQLPVAKLAVTGRGRASKIELRPAYGSQDVVFAATLPVGLILTDHVRVPNQLKEHL